jgi:hypothetical protein
MPLDDLAALALRREIYADGAAGRPALLRLIETARAQGGPVSHAFVELMAEVAVDALLNEVDPPKYIRRSDADWLLAHLSKDGGLANEAEYDMLLRVIRGAVSVPPPLAAFAVAEMERVIVSGAAWRDPRALSPQDVEAMRAVVFAATEGSSLYVSRHSAEALFRIADALVDVEEPAFEQFFAQAIGNYLMGIAWRWTSSAAESREADDWLDDRSAGFRGFVSSMFAFDRLKAVREAREMDARQNAADEMLMGEAERIDAAEADWLLARLHRDGRISEAEKRLLRFLREESPSIAPALAALIDRAA